METERKSSKFETGPVVEFSNVPANCELNVTAVSLDSKLVGHWEVRGGAATETVQNELVSVSAADGRLTVTGVRALPTMLQCALHHGCLADLEMNVVAE